MTHRTEDVPPEPVPGPASDPKPTSASEPNHTSAAEPDAGRPVPPVEQRGFAAELRDAVTVRSFVLVLGVLVLQLGFIASYLGAFHNPQPRDIPIAVAAPAGAPTGSADQAVARLNQLPGHPVKARAASDATAALGLLNDRTVYGVVLLGPGNSDRLQVASAAGASVSSSHQMSADTYSLTISFTFEIGSKAYSWNWSACSRDTVDENGLGVPGHHGCGSPRIRTSLKYAG